MLLDDYDANEEPVDGTQEMSLGELSDDADTAVPEDVVENAFDEENAFDDPDNAVSDSLTENTEETVAGDAAEYSIEDNTDE